MMRHLLLLALLVACKRAPTPKTTQIATSEFAEPQTNDVCSDSFLLWDSTDGSLPKDRRDFRRRSCDLHPSRASEPSPGTVVVTFQGGVINWRDGYCGVHIGPGLVSVGVDPTIITKFVEDPALAKKLADLMHGVDPTREYSLQASVDGVQVDIGQHRLFRIGGVVSVLELRLDGCAQFEDPGPPVLKLGSAMPQWPEQERKDR